MTLVLAVDDEPQLLRALITNLRARGYEVDGATTGEIALEMAARHHPDVVVLDLGLPTLSGIEVIHGLRGWSDVPIIVLSARDAERDKIAALDAGADDYVTKPFGMGELLARVRAALRRGAPATEEADDRHRRVHHRSRRQARHERERRGAAHAHRVAPRGDARAQRGQARDPGRAAPRGVGPGVRDRDQLPARLHGAHPAQARARSGQSRASSSPSPAWATGSRSRTERDATLSVLLTCARRGCGA